LPQEFVPSDVDEAEFEIRIEGPQAASPTSMAQAMLAVENEVRNTRGVRTVLVTAGGGFLGSANQGQVYVRIAPHDERLLSFSRFFKDLFRGRPMDAFRGNYSQSDVMQDLRRRLAKFRELRPQIRNFAGFNIGGGNFDIDFVIRGPDLEALERYGNVLRDRIRSNAIPGIVDANTTLRLDKPEIRVTIDRGRAADLGVDARDIGTALRLMVGGDEQLSRFRDPQAGEDYDVQLRLDADDRSDPDVLQQLYLPRQGGGLVELGNVASLQPVNSASRIDRSDRQREVRLRAGIAPGYAMADRLDALRQAATDMDLPPGYTVAVSGKGRELERTFTEFLFAFALSVVFMYMILAMNYESIVHPFTILLSLPLTVPFALLSLWLSGGTLNLYSALGLLVLFGVVKKNAILQIDHMNHLRNEGVPRFDAIIQGNRDRLRPILMTTLALIAGMLPLALGTGPGAEERRAVAVVVIGGQSLALLLTLLVTPVAYSLLDDFGAWMAMRKKTKVTGPAPAPHPATVPSAGAGS
jgi:hydrophobic/amphiphilic exporter-1 (mainly G- bacteria), HAE1 family